MSKLQLATQVVEQKEIIVRLAKRYRKAVTVRALKQPALIYVLARDEVADAVRGGGW